jgi:hypothetical protein
MARIRVVLDGHTASNGSPLLMHNERLADPLDPYTKWLAELTGKRTKTERDIEEMARREFLGAGYWANDDGPEGTQSEPVIPTWNIVRCLQESASRHKLGKHILRGIIPVDEMTPLIYDGPRDADAMWKAGTFHSRKGVAVGQRRVIRTRPCFTDWSVEAELELDLTILDPMQVNQIAAEAGRYCGLGDARPRFGRFLGSATLLGDPAMFLAVDQLDDVRQALAATTARAAINAADTAHSLKNPNGKERAKRVTKATN